MRYFLFIFGLCVVAVKLLLGPRGRHFRKPPLYIFPDMERQLKLRPQKDNTFFANGISSQTPVAGTIPRSDPIITADGRVYPFEESPVNTGHVKGTTNFVENIPLPVTQALMMLVSSAFRSTARPVTARPLKATVSPKKLARWLWSRTSMTNAS